MFGYTGTEDRRGMRSVGIPACPQSGTSTLFRRDEQHQNLPGLLRPEASV